MNIFLTGASGFIGRHVAKALIQAGHDVLCAGRAAGCVPVDFTRDTRVEVWLPRLTGIDVVINAVGIFREEGLQTFETIHTLAPQALFAACEAAGVRRIIQLSALGADEQARSRFHLSKRRADEFLATLTVDHCIVQPSLVYGPDGESARLFTRLASIPWLPLPGGGHSLVQPVHIDDVVSGIVSLVEISNSPASRMAFVGPEPLRFRDFLANLRAQLDLPSTHYVSIRLGVARVGARAAARFQSSLLDPESLDMLLRGNTADPAPFARLLNRPLRSPSQFIERETAATVRAAAQVHWLASLLRWSIALVWIVTGVISLGLYPVERSYELLARAGVPDVLAPLMLYGAALMDLAFGIATLTMRRRQMLWLVQIVVILVYTIIISLRMPEFWLHPFGPLLKNLPMLAAIVVLQQLESRRWNT
jgi:uncharacterized protein YbjT (DUF2867 family)